jgi:hypothetical protein
MRKVAWILAVLVACILVGWLVFQRDRQDLTGAPRALDVDSAASRESPPASRDSKPTNARIRPARFPGDDDDTPEALAARASVTLTGRVVDGSWRPVPGAPLRVVRPDVPARTTSADKSGRFRIDLGPWGAKSVIHGTIVAGDAKIGACLASIYPSRTDPRNHDLGDLVLRPAGSLDVLVRDGNAAVAGAAVAIVGAYRFQGYAHDTVASDDFGRAVLTPVPQGSVTVMAWTLDGRVGSRICEVPLRTASPLVIELGLGNVLEVTVRSREDHRPVPGASIELFERERDVGFRMSGYLHRAGAATRPITTDESGTASIAGIMPDLPLLASATAPGFAAPRLEDAVEVAPHAREVTIELLPLVEAGFPLADPADAPPDGTELSVVADPLAPRTTPLAARARIAGRFVVVEGLATEFLSVLVQAKDGRVGRIARGTRFRPADPVSFRAPRFLDVDVFRADGSRAPGVRVTVCSYPIYGFGASAVTGDTGCIRIGPFWGGDAEIYVDDGVGELRHCASAKMGDGDAKVRLDLAGVINLVIRCTLDGERRLPPEFDLWVKGATQGAQRTDAERAEISCALWPAAPDGPVTAQLMCTGFVTWSSGTLPRPVDGRIIVDAPLVSGSTVAVNVAAPSDGEAEIDLMRWDARRDRYTPAIRCWAGHSSRGPEAGSFIVTFRGVSAGRWCARDQLTGLMSAPVEVAAESAAEASQPARPALDLSHAGWVTGRVDTPTPADTSDARVTFSGTDIRPAAYMIGASPERYEGVTINPDGTFRLRVPGDRPIKLVPMHPKLVAAADGEATVTEPRGDVRLRLVPAGRVHFTIERDGVAGPTPGATHFAQVFRSGVEGVPVSTHRIEIEGNAASLTGVPAGTWTIWLNVDPFQPIVLAGVTVDQDETDLGRVSFEGGSELEIHVIERPGRSLSRIRVQAWHRDDPAYSRTAQARSGQPCIVHGLGPGRFLVRITPNDRAEPDPRDFEITADGLSKVRLDYDAP